MQRPGPGLDSCEWLGVWDSMGKYLGQWAPLVCFKLALEQVQNLNNLVKYLQKVCCHPGNFRDTNNFNMLGSGPRLSSPVQPDSVP